jgi:hypothetical protein
MQVGNELKGIGNTFNQVGLLDISHGLGPKLEWNFY